MILKILVLAIIQGIAELLPISSSAHVIMAKKLMGIDPTSPPMTLLLVMLHTGTMFAVIIYYWKSWKNRFFASKEVFFHAFKCIGTATAVTIIVGLTLKEIIERVLLNGQEIETLFGNLSAISVALAVVGIFIIWAGLKSKERGRQLDVKESAVIGAVQGLCLPFRGFSRSGATISTGLMLGMERRIAEDFSFALAVVLTPPVLVRQILRLLNSEHAAAAGSSADVFALFIPSLIGMVFSFLAGLVALRWLSSWLEQGRWHYFGYYCLFASAVAFTLHSLGY
jgi:undecaprenyl-diphosphatase